MPIERIVEVEKIVQVEKIVDKSAENPAEQVVIVPEPQIVYVDRIIEHVV